MRQATQMKLIPALLLVAFSGTASASGFQLLEQNASGIGNGYAGSAAVAENASTIFYNPAGMTQLQAREISGGLSAIQTSFKFTNNGSSVGVLAGAGNGGDGGGLGFVPNGYLSWALNKDLYVGVGVGAPFGLRTEYNSPWVGAAQATMFDVKTYNINPSIAYRVNNTVSLGAGLNWQRIEAEYTRQAAVVSAGTASIKSTMNLSDDSWGWNVGALFTLSPATKVGVSYRSKVKYNTTGDVKLSGDGSALSTGTLNALVASGSQSNVMADLTLPDTVILSVTQQLSDKWLMLGDISWTGWSSIPKLDIIRTSGLQNSRIAQTLDTDFRDTWRVSLGANYKLNDSTKLKFGIAHDQTPVKGAATRLTSLPDNDRTWISAGVQWMPSKGSALDLGLSYLYVKDSTINNNQTAAGRGLVAGNFDASVWILGGQYSMAF